jgi:hypothetical protein
MGFAFQLSQAVDEVPGFHLIQTQACQVLSVANVFLLVTTKLIEILNN